VPSLATASAVVPAISMLTRVPLSTGAVAQLVFRFPYASM